VNRGRRADEVVGRCRERLDRGERVDPDEVVREHPDLAEILRPRLAALELLRRSRPSAPSLLGRRLGRYRLESELGSGGMGSVYTATDDEEARTSGRRARYAVKVVHPHLVERPGFAGRFEREGAIGRRVRHANVVETYDFGVTVDGAARVLWLAMEYVEGRTLRELIDDRERLPEDLCRHVGREVANALAAIHAAGAVHRDLKPENVLITSGHVVKVMDLGVAALTDEEMRLSQTGAFVGSIRCAAPEQLERRGAVDARTDLHALGLLLYELATGVHPFDGEEFAAVVRRLLDERPRRIGVLDPQLSPLLEELVAQLLEKDPARRVQTAAEVALILEQGEESEWWRARSNAIRRETRRPLRRIRLARETDVHGRDAEFSRLRALFKKAEAGDGQVVLVEGEAGIGKSRLVDEFAVSLWTSGADFDFLFGGYPPGGAATASGAFSGAYGEHLGCDVAAIREVLPQTPLLAPAFAALLSGDKAPESAERLTKDSMQTVFVHATRSLAARRTTIVLIDDLHFAPEEGRALFAALALAVAGHRILLVGTARPEIDPKWLTAVERIGATRIALDRLGAKDLVGLLRDALRSEHLAEELAGKIATKSDGNPFFVFEILRALRDGSLIARRDDGTWIRTSEIREIKVPSTVVDLVQSRISGLGLDDRNVLEAAACVGFEFDPALVAAVLPLPLIPLLQRLGQIEKSHRLVRSVGRRFAFDHHQVAEVLSVGLSPPLREAYHARIAEAVESQSGALALDPSSLDGALCVELATHFFEGALGKRALRYLDGAMTHLERGYLNDAAIRLSDRALTTPGLDDGRERAELLLRKAARLDLIGRSAAGRPALDEAVALADRDGDPGLRARARRALGAHLWSLSRNDEAMSRLVEAQELARTAGDRAVEAAATGSIGAVLWSQGRLDAAREHHERHFELASEIGDLRSEAQAVGNLGAVLRALGDLPAARRHLERHLALARETNDLRGEAAATGNLGLVLSALGRLAEAEEHHERHFAIAREIGDRTGESRALGNLGLVFSALGRFDEARSRHERHLALAQETDDRRGEAVATGNLGIVFLSLGRLADARERFERHLVLAKEVGDRRQETRATGNLGLADRLLGRVAEARAEIELFLASAREIRDRRQEGFALQFLGDLAAEVGDSETARLRFDEALALRRTLGQRDGEAQSLLARGALLARLGKTTEARTDLAEALAIARELSLRDVELLAAAHDAAIPGGDLAAALDALEAHEGRVEVSAAMEARLVLFRATGQRPHLVEAKLLLDRVVANAPPECRETMIANVRVHRDVTQAARKHRVE
jgi:tetratricopeptide (TPR) repeat protein